MNKKELESIYNRLESTIIKLGRQNGKTQAVKDLIYLFEQVERVQELEADNYNMGVELEKLYKQNKCYREALLKIDDFDIELGDMREDLQEKLLQIKYIKDKTLEETEWI